jgi:hypothetical protein
VHPRWGRVHVKGNGNTDDYKVGDWVLIEHGRWTRTINVDQDDGSVLKVWIVDETGIIGWSDETPEEMGEQIEEYLKKNLINIIGGCCGTTPEHIKIIANIASKYNPRAQPSIPSQRERKQS